MKKSISKSKKTDIWNKDLKATGMAIFLLGSLIIIGMVIYALQNKNENMDSRSHASGDVTPAWVAGILKQYPPPIDPTKCPVWTDKLQNLIANNPNRVNLNKINECDPKSEYYWKAKEKCTRPIVYEALPNAANCKVQRPSWGTKVCIPKPTFPPGAKIIPPAECRPGGN
jgi:hypothetical protein